MNKNEMFPKGFFSKNRPEVKTYIELIDKYAICQSDSDEYNPPSYIWTDNTGELIRCKDCRYLTQSTVFDRTTLYCYRHRDDDGDWECLENDEGFCSWAVRKEK